MFVLVATYHLIYNLTFFRIPQEQGTRMFTIKALTGQYPVPPVNPLTIITGTDIRLYNFTFSPIIDKMWQPCIPFYTHMYLFVVLNNLFQCVIIRSVLIICLMLAALGIEEYVCTPLASK